MIPIPESLGGVTSEWLTVALRASGGLGEATVTVRDLQPIGSESGFASQVGRVDLVVSRPTPSLPGSMVVKLAEGKYAREGAFYSRIWPDVGARTPACYFAAHQAESGRSVLLLEDLRTARFGDAARSWSQAEAESIVDALAGLHARWWNSPNLDLLAWLPPYGDVGPQLEKLPARRIVFMERFGPMVSRDLDDLTLGLGQQVAGRLRRLSARPQTLLHGDLHLDNVAFLNGESGQPVLLDWQCVAKGLGVVDLACFISTGSPEERRASEQSLLERYHAGLAAAGVTGYSLETVMHDYRVALLRWWIGTVNGYGSPDAQGWTGRQAQMARQSVRWWNDVAQDHDLAGLIAAS